MSLLDPTQITTTDDGSELLVDRNLEAMHDDVSLDELDRMSATWRRPEGYEWGVQSVRDGRLLLGLWRECGPFDIVPEGTVPVAVATASTAYLAAYLYLGLDGDRAENDQLERSRGRTRQSVAELMGVERKRSVTNYLSKVRVSWEDVETGE